MNDLVPPPASPVPASPVPAPGQPAWAPPPPSPRAASSIAALVLLVVVFVIGIAVGSSGVLGRSSSVGGSSGSPPAGPGQPGASAAPSADANAPFNFDLFGQALSVIGQNFVGRANLDPTTLTYGAIRGLVLALGDTDHTVFLTPAEAQAEQSALDQNVVGIGVLLGTKDGQPVVVSVVPQSPAQAAGLKAGDFIVAVNGQDVTSATPDQIVTQVRGDAGTTVQITIQRPSTGERLDFSIVRQKITFPSVSWTMVPGTTVALIRMSQFAASSADELLTARDAAVGQGATSIILDLRGNPGGYVDEAVKAASEFLHGKTVYIRELADGSRVPVMTDDSVASSDVPLVVMVDNNTASSAEIMSGAIKSAGRAPIVGATTFGTGTVLLPYTLSDGSVIRLAIERWLTPDGELIFGKGITPTDPVALGPSDVPIEPTDLQGLTADQLDTISDTQLLRALQLAGGPTISPLPASSSPAAQAPTPAAPTPAPSP
ncbi:MAG TPA: S41 family peptidase [Candidatus Limnocylindrales bacterium]